MEENLGKLALYQLSYARNTKNRGFSRKRSSFVVPELSVISIVWQG